MLFRDSQLRNRAHLNRLRQLDIPGVTPPGAEGDDDEEKPPVGGGVGQTTPPAPTSTRENPVASKPPASTSTSTSTRTSSTTTSTTTTQPPANNNSQSQSQAPPPPTSTEDNAQPTVSNVLPGVTQTIDPGTINNNVVGYTNTYSPTGEAMIIPSTTSTSDKTPEGSSNTVKYIGYAAGAIVGFALLVSLIMFIMRRLNKKRENEALGDVFDRNSFVRDSVAIPDHGDDLPSDRGRPRPPTMIARHIGATGGNNTPFAGGYDGGYGGGAPMPPMPDNGGYYGNNDGYNGNNGGYNGNGYDQYASGHGYNGGYDQQYDQYGHYAPPQQGYASYQDSPMHSPMDPYSDHSAQYLNHQVGNEYPTMPPAAVASPTDTGRTLTRQPSSNGHANVAELGRGTSVTPYQAAQYAEIGKRLDDPAPNGGHGYNKVDRHPGQQRQPTLDDAYGGI